MKSSSFKNITIVFLKIFFPLFLFTLAGFAVHSALIEFRSVDLAGKIHETPFDRLMLSLLFTGLAYFFSIGYDRTAVKIVGGKLPFRKNALLTSISYGIGNSTGLGGAGTNSVRFHLYSQWGYSLSDIARIVLYAAISFWIGFLFLGVFLFPMIKLPVGWNAGLNLPLWPLSVFFAVLILTYFALPFFKIRILSFRNVSVEIPSFFISVQQLFFSVADWLFSSLALYIFFPEITFSGFIAFSGFFLFSQLIGMLSNIPGGLGVFEAGIVLFASSSGFDPASTLSNLILFRITYYFIPLCAGSLLLIFHEIRVRQEAVYSTVKGILSSFSKIIPETAAVITFITGAFLVITGSFPDSSDRLKALSVFVPLVLIESSHFFASLTGTAMLFVANGLRRRIKASWTITVFLMSAGCVFSILKGFDFEKVFAILLFISVLIYGRKEFYRLEKLFVSYLRTEQIVITGIVIVFSIWLGFFNYKHVDYSHELWWQFTLLGHAPRFLRGEAGVICLVILLGIIRIVHPGVPRSFKKSEEETAGEDLDSAYRLALSSPSSCSFLALTGDKKLLFSTTGSSFIMSGTMKNTRVSMGNPVGDREEWQELIWEFIEDADRNNARAAFYHVDKSSLDLYLEAGMNFFKIGEVARVNLEGFTLDTPERKHIRYSYRKGEKDGLLFEVVYPPHSGELLEKLKNISDRWLSDKNTAEKGFSLGFFSEAYFNYCPCALVKKENSILAFANLWLPDNREEFSIDLMRFLQEAPSGIMDYLFTSLLLWGSGKGYRFFNLGAAPLSGLTSRPSAPAWNKLGNFIFSHGEHFYNFGGLRKFKEKFYPVWEPEYIACRPGLNVPFIISDITSLISGGVKGIFSRKSKTG